VSRAANNGLSDHLDDWTWPANTLRSEMSRSIIQKNGEKTVVAGRLGLLRLEALPMRGLLGPVAADGHAAPAPCMAACVVGEQQGTIGPFTGLYVGKVFRTNQLRHRFGNRH
jgi:hypothetical protein